MAFTIGAASCIVPIGFFIAQMLTKFKSGARLNHSYITINFLQILCIFGLYDIDLLPNMIHFFKGVFFFAHFRFFGLDNFG
jgi:hypothetical protein